MLNLAKTWDDSAGGIKVTQSGYSDEVIISYSGLLAKLGAEQVYLHYGYGNPHYWYNVSTQEMYRTPRGWEKTIKLLDDKANFCFKDSANNWDNNNGNNWLVRM